MLWLGIGCQRDTNEDFINESIQRLFREYGLQITDLTGVATLDRKYNETGIITVARIYNLQLQLFSAQELSQIKVANPSTQVNDQIQTFSVAEAAAILAVKSQLEPINSAQTRNHIAVHLQIPKTIFKNANADGKGSVTFAVAKAKYV